MRSRCDNCPPCRVARCRNQEGTGTRSSTSWGAYGYPAAGRGRPQVWALAASHPASADAWEDFLRASSTPRFLRGWSAQTGL